MAQIADVIKYEGDNSTFIRYTVRIPVMQQQIKCSYSA